MEQQIFGRIAAHTQFRKYHQIRLHIGTSAVRVVDDFLGVAGDIADCKVELGYR